MTQGSIGFLPAGGGGGGFFARLGGGGGAFLAPPAPPDGIPPAPPDEIPPLPIVANGVPTMLELLPNGPAFLAPHSEDVPIGEPVFEAEELGLIRRSTPAEGGRLKRSSALLDGRSAKTSPLLYWSAVVNRGILRRFDLADDTSDGSVGARAGVGRAIGDMSLYFCDG
jgi:hypothetical protein